VKTADNTPTAAIWAAMAFAAMGDSKRAWGLFDMINPVNHAASPEAVAVTKLNHM
jgi:cyclic beta-1,2-glucan synthetase